MRSIGHKVKDKHHDQLDVAAAFGWATFDASRNGVTGLMKVYYRGERIGFSELKEPTRKVSLPIPLTPRIRVVRRPKKDHPWRKGWQNIKPLFPEPTIAVPLIGIRTYASP